MALNICIAVVVMFTVLPLLGWVLLFTVPRRICDFVNEDRVRRGLPPVRGKNRPVCPRPVR